MYTGAEALFNRAYGALDLANMAVRRDDVQFGWSKVNTDAFEFIVSVKVTDAQTAGSVQSEDGSEFREDGLVGAVCNRCHGAKTDAAGNGVEESDTLHKKEIGAQRDVAVVQCDGRGEGHSLESGGTRCRFGPHCLAFEGSDVRAINVRNPASVIWCHGAVADKVLGENQVKLGFTRASNLTVEVTCEVGCCNLLSGKQLLLLSYGGDHGVGINARSSLALRTG
jgi:hypothetical protein